MPPPRRALEVRKGDGDSRKWCTPMREEVFDALMARGGDDTIKKVFGEGSLSSPLLFGKFFDPADAFPLWDFESDILLSGLRSNAKNRVDWSETDNDYILRAELPDIIKNNIDICIENGKVIEISGRWKGRESDKKDWRAGNWWEYGFVRRLELPDDTSWRKMVAYIDEDIILEIRIPKNTVDYSVTEGNNVDSKESVCI